MTEYRVMAKPKTGKRFKCCATYTDRVFAEQDARFFERQGWIVKIEEAKHDKGIHQSIH